MSPADLATYCIRRRWQDGKMIEQMRVPTSASREWLYDIFDVDHVLTSIAAVSRARFKEGVSPRWIFSCDGGAASGACSSSAVFRDMMMSDVPKDGQ